MKGHAQRRAYQLFGQRICKSHAPGKPRGLSITAARGKAAETANGVAQGDPGGKDVHSLEDRHLMTPGIEQPGYEGSSQPAGKYPG